MTGKGRRSWLLLLFRSLSLGFLLFQALRYLEGTLPPLPVTIMFLFALAAAVFLEQRKMRFLPAAVLFAGVLTAGRLLFFGFFRLLQYWWKTPEADFLFFRFDTFFLPMLIPAALGWIFTFLSRRYPRFVPWECGLHVLLFIGLFWSQGGFSIDLYPHPGLLALAATVFIFLQIAILFETIRLNHPASGKKKGFSLAFLWVLLPILLLFLLFMYNRYTREAVTQGGGLIKPTFFRFDFSRYIHLESEISLSDDLVLLVRMEQVNRSALLRRFILAGYRPEEGFFFEAEPGSGGFRTTVPDGPITLQDPGYQGREDLTQEYYIVNFDPSSLLGIDYPVSIVPLVNWDSSSFLRVYRVHSRANGFYPMELSECPDPRYSMDKRLYEYYTSFGDDRRVRVLSEEVTSQAETYYERVTALETYLLDNYFYSLKPGVAADGNQLHHFLFESRKGYCSYFAFAMAVMARSVGIPARVAVGFFTDPASELFNYHPVRADMAHAWVEVFFPGYGWVEFDPTSMNIAPGEEYQFADMDMREVSRLIEEILKNRYQLKDDEGAEESEESILPWYKKTLDKLKRLMNFWYVVLPLLYLTGCLVVRCILYLRCFTVKEALQRVRRIYRRRVFILRSLGAGRRGNETVWEYALRLDKLYDLSMADLTESCLKALFSRSFDQDDLTEALNRSKAVAQAVRQAFPWTARVLGFLNPLGIRGRRR